MDLKKKLIKERILLHQVISKLLTRESNKSTFIIYSRTLNYPKNVKEEIQ